MTEEEIFNKTYNQALHFLSYRPRSEHEIRNYLSSKVKNQEIIEKIIIKLAEDKLVNDQEFADWWIEQRLEFNQKGPKIIKGELLLKGIDREIIQEKIAAITKKQLKEAINKILLKQTDSGNYNKLLKHVLVKGFEYDISKQLVDEFIQNR